MSTISGSGPGFHQIPPDRNEEKRANRRDKSWSAPGKSLLPTPTGESPPPPPVAEKVASATEATLSADRTSSSPPQAKWSKGSVSQERRQSMTMRLSQKIGISKYPLEQITRACQDKDSGNLKRLLEKIDDLELNPLNHVIETGDLEGVKFFINDTEGNKEFNENNLIFAVKNHASQEMTSLLLNKLKEENSDKDIAMMMYKALKVGLTERSADLVKFALDHGAKVTEDTIAKALKSQNPELYFPQLERFAELNPSEQEIRADARTARQEGVPTSLSGVKINTSPQNGLIALLKSPAGCLIEKSTEYPDREMYSFTFNNDKGLVTYFVEIPMTDNRQEIRETYEILRKIKQDKIQAAGQNKTLIQEAKDEFREDMKKAGKTQIPGQLHFYEVDQKTNELVPAGFTYDSLGAFFRHYHLPGNDKSKRQIQECFITEELYREIDQKSQKLTKPPTLEGVATPSLVKFVHAFLEPYTKGRVSPEEAQKRKPIMEELKNQMKALDPLKTIDKDLEKILAGTYAKKALEDFHNHIGHQGRMNKESIEFKHYCEALKMGIKHDFPNAFTDSDIDSMALSALRQVNIDKSKAQAG